MTPMLGIMASMLSGHLSSFESIQTVTVGGGGASSISFTSIPQTYKHLQIRGVLRSNRAAQAQDQMRLQFNGDTGANYATHYMSGGSSAVGANGFTGQAYTYDDAVPASTALASVFGAMIMDILDYTSANKNKTTRMLSGYDNNGSGTLELVSGLWLNTGAITDISIFALGNYIQYSQLALYGLKG